MSENGGACFDCRHYRAEESIYPFVIYRNMKRDDGQPVVLEHVPDRICVKHNARLLYTGDGVICFECFEPKDGR